VGVDINIKTGTPLPMAPDGKGFLSMNLMSDARHLTLHAQALGATQSHLEGETLPEETLRALVAFVEQVYAAQSYDKRGGSLVEEGGPAGLGPHNLHRADSGLPGDSSDTPVFQTFDQWKKPSDPFDPQATFRASVARGADIFMFRLFWISDAANLTSIGLGNPLKRTCSTCHNAQMTGNDLAPGWMDIGLHNWPWSRGQEAELPLFKLTCKAEVPPHPFLGRVIYTTDPGRALITGRCTDIGSLTMQQMRALAPRAPYFNNGSAKSLREVVDFYDRRFNIGYTDQEKEDLVNFLSTL